MAITIDARPAKLDLPLYEGDDFSLGVTFDFDPAAYTDWKGQIRYTPGSDDILAEFDVDAVTTIADFRIQFDLPGVVDISYDKAGYDLEVVTPDGKLVTFMAGLVTVKPQYTRT